MIWTSKSREIFFEVQDAGRPITGTIGLLNLASEGLLRPADVVSLTVTEELGKMPTGSLLVRDPNHVYSRVFRRGRELTVAWGYTMDPSRAVAVGDVVTPAVQRRGLRVVVMSPSGGGAENGLVTTAINFMAVAFRGLDGVRVYSAGTKWSVVTQICAGMGVVPEVNFRRMAEPVTPEAEIRQTQPDFQFLNSLAREWGAMVIAGYDPAGVPHLAFMDPERIPDSATVKLIAGSPFHAGGFRYKSGSDANALSYSWSLHEGESGGGDAISVALVNGQYVVTRRVVEDEKVVAWKLNPQRIEDEFQRRAADGGVVGQGELVREVLAATDFEQVRRFFDAIEAETAPQGFGYEVTVNMLGNTTVTAGMDAQFADGFPDFLAKPDDIGGLLRRNRFYAQKVTHTLNESGYRTSVEVADVFSETPTGVDVVGSLF